MRTTHTIAFAIAVLAASPAKRSGEIEEIPGLSLRGEGCHVELLAPNGSTICTGIATSLPKCFPMTALTSSEDGGMRVERFHLGSSCRTPRITSASLGPGSYFVDSADGGKSIICDNASSCQRRVFRERILNCCRHNTAIRDTAICDEPPQVGVCVEPNEIND